jgi:cell division septum initiation protein DivIVA
MHNAIVQLQQDILDQNDVNHSQQSAISHLEVVVADLVARVAKAEDKENVPDMSNQRSNRSTAGHPVI